jgi:hypothetical protein
VLYALFYETADGGAARAPEFMDAHRTTFRRFHAEGRLKMIGTFGDPQTEGAMGIFATREAAEAFAGEDPFVANGVVGNWYIREWDEVFSRDAGAP